MSARRLALLFVAALVVIACAIWLSSQRHLDRSIEAGTPVMPLLKPALNEVSELRFAKADGTHATLRKTGADWLVVERNFAADAGRVRKLLLDAAALKIVEEKTSDSKRYADLSVEDVAAVSPETASAPKPPKENRYDYSTPAGATRVDFITAKQSWSLINGKSAGAKSGYVRVAGTKQSLLASPRLDPDADPQRWLDKSIADIPEARIQSVNVQPAKGPAYTVSRAKREDENFTVVNVPKNRKLSGEGAGNSLASGLESLQLDDVRAAPGAAPAPVASQTIELSRATYRTFDGVTVQVAGRKESSPGLEKDDPKLEHFFVTLAASSSDKATQAEAQKLNTRVTGREFEISSYKYDGMFKPLDDLLEALPSKGK